MVWQDVVAYSPLMKKSSSMSSSTSGRLSSLLKCWKNENTSANSWYEDGRGPAGLSSHSSVFSIQQPPARACVVKFPAQLRVKPRPPHHAAPNHVYSRDVISESSWAWLDQVLAMMRSFLCLFAALGLAFGFSSSKPQWNSAFADAVVDCPDYPPPAISSDTLLQQLQPFLNDLAKNMSNLLQLTESPGGVAIGLVYNQTLLWTKGFGQTNKIS